MAARETLLLGELNDGSEPQFPSSDVVRTCLFCQILFGQELDRRLAAQLPDWWSEQGAEDDLDNSGIGLAIKPGVGTVQNFYWVRLGTWAKPDRGVQALVVHFDYQGCPLALISTKRPAKSHADNWPTFDDNLGDLILRERHDRGRIPIVGLDANSANDPALRAATRLTWYAPYPTSIVGFLMPTSISVLATTRLMSTGEHAPVISMVRVPLQVA